MYDHSIILQGKRGIEKQPFQLPDFIAAIGIEKIRQVLHDAFFKYQTKPKLTAHGDLYHEGKELEVKLREMKPGMLSHELKEALGMRRCSSPWLINMQSIDVIYLILTFKEEPVDKTKHWGDLEEEEKEEEEDEEEVEEQIEEEELEAGIQSVDSLSRSSGFVILIK
ncbi:Splicing factor 3B subunit 2 [Camellia lanceoleosa]|uniref:Splicing factor 3B subunit 2 n=1 Tax=Camellia lanceoleosa TaxID=1840588 RepID=A0ACC0GM93_9ERIC|nr:Splicing factor 3B subunit 2 [Camellia lanceoleosa]